MTSAVVNQDEAGIIRQIYERYLELGGVRQLKKELDERGIVSAIKVTRKGNPRGGKRFSRGRALLFARQSGLRRANPPQRRAVSRAARSHRQ